MEGCFRQWPLRQSFFFFYISFYWAFGYTHNPIKTYKLYVNNHCLFLCVVTSVNTHIWHRVFLILCLAVLLLTVTYIKGWSKSGQALTPISQMLCTEAILLLQGHCILIRLEQDTTPC